MTLALLNGQQTTSLSIADRGLSYGDGVFETLRVTQAKPCYWQQHILRLCDGLVRLKFDIDIEEIKSQLFQETQELLTKSSELDSTLKITVTRGESSRGYRAPSSVNPTRIVQLSPAPHYPENYTSTGISLFECATRLAEQPLLAGIKHLNRLEQVLARSEWGDDFQEGLMLSTSGLVIEGVMSNLFLLKNGSLITPEIKLAGVNGILRQRVIAWAQATGIDVQEKPIVLNEVTDADAIFMTNSLIGVWPVQQFRNNHFAIPEILPKLTRWLDEDALASLEQFS